MRFSLDNDSQGNSQMSTITNIGVKVNCITRALVAVSLDSLMQAGGMCGTSDANFSFMLALLTLAPLTLGLLTLAMLTLAQFTLACSC